MKVPFSILTTCVLFSLVSASADIIHVPGDYLTIQDAIDASTAGDTVLAEPNRYLENINFRGRNIVVASNYILDGDPAHISNTIIDGSEPLHPDTASCVLIVSGEDSTAVLAGFTLTGGQGTVWQDIHNHLWYREGGGILIELSSPTIRDNIITANEAIDDSGIQSAGGGGIRAGDGNPVIERNEISYNSGLYGGGIVLNYATGIIRNNIVCRNSGGQDYGGGGIWTYAGGQTLIENNTIAQNSSVMDGGGLLVWSTSVTAKNNIIYGNMDSHGYPQVRLRPGGTAWITYSDIEGGWDGEGNIDLDPLFRDLANDDFHLMSDSCGDVHNSPCIDAGDPGISDALYGCDWGLGQLRSDMGAYGGGDSVTVGIDYDKIPLPDMFSLSQNFPNPFNAITIIQYSLSSASDVTVEIYNLLGQRVATVFEGTQEAGEHSVTWDAGDHSSGLYFYQIQAGNHAETRNMVLLK